MVHHFYRMACELEVDPITIKSTVDKTLYLSGNTISGEDSIFMLDDNKTSGDVTITNEKVNSRSLSNGILSSWTPIELGAGIPTGAIPTCSEVKESDIFMQIV